MQENEKLDDIRRTALTLMERKDKKHKKAIIAAAFLEGAFLITFCLLADFHNRMHVLLLLSTIAIYSIVGAGLAALGILINQSALRILKALELSGKREA